MFCDRIFISIAPHKHVSWRTLAACKIACQTVEGGGQTGNSVFLWRPLRGVMPIWQIYLAQYNSWGDNMSRIILRSRGQMPRSNGSFLSWHEFFLSCPPGGSELIWLIRFIWGTDTTYEEIMYVLCIIFRSKRQGHTGRSNFCFVGSMSISPISFIDGVKQHVRWRCVPFPGQNIKRQGHTSRSIFCCVCYMAPCIFDRFPSHVVQIQPMMWQCAVNHFQVTRSFDVVWCSSFMASFLFDHFPSYGAPVQPTRRRCVRYHSQVKVQGHVPY